jgi:hypothetical protein
MHSYCTFQRHLDVLLKIQDGSLQNHTTEEARSCFLSCDDPLPAGKLKPIFNRLVALFGSSISRNTPKSLLKGDINTIGKCVYHFKAFVALAVVFRIG